MGYFYHHKVGVQRDTSTPPSVLGPNPLPPPPPLKKYTKILKSQPHKKLSVH